MKSHSSRLFVVSCLSDTINISLEPVRSSTYRSWKLFSAARILWLTGPTYFPSQFSQALPPVSDLAACNSPQQGSKTASLCGSKASPETVARAPAVPALSTCRCSFLPRTPFRTCDLHSAPTSPATRHFTV